MKPQSLLQLVAALLAAAPLRAAITFTDSGQVLGNNNTIRNGVAVGDLDGDGDLDAVVVGAVTKFWINQGGAQMGSEGEFAAGAEFDLGVGTAIAMDDLDNDGDLDFVTLHGPFADSIRVWINEGGIQGGTEGDIEPVPPMFGNDRGTALAIGKLGTNTIPHLFVARDFNRPDNVWRNDGTGQFSEWTQTLAGSTSTDVTLGDMDGDGALDAFVVGPGANRVLINFEGSGSFVDSGQSLGNESTLSVALGDLDGDGDLDAVTGESSGVTKVWINQGPATPGVFADSGQSLGSGSAQHRDVALGDFDRDGDLDAFVASSSTNRVFENNGSAVFTDTGLALGNSFSEGVALGDLDGDGDLDAFVANSGAGGVIEVWVNTTPLGPFGLTDPTDPLLYVTGVAPLFPNVLLETHQPVNWEGATLTIQITTNSNEHRDQLHLVESDGLNIAGTPPDRSLLLDGIEIGRLEGSSFVNQPGTPFPSSGQIIFNANASTEAVQEVLQHLAYEWFGSFDDQLILFGPFHVEPPRTIVLSLLDVSNNVSTLSRTLPFNRLVGIEVFPRIAVLGRLMGKDDESFVAAGRYLSGDYKSLTAVLTPQVSWVLQSSVNVTLQITTPDAVTVSASQPTVFGRSTILTAQFGPYTDSAFIVVNGQLSCVAGLAFLLAGQIPEAPTNTVQAASDSPPFTLAPFHALEQLMNQTSEGQRLAGLYWQHTAEALGIVSSNIHLVPGIIEVMADFEPGVGQLLGGDGSGFQITQAMIDRLNTVWDDVIALASPAFSQALQEERAVFNGFQDFVGTDFNQWAQMLDVTAPSEPFVFVSRPRYENGRFSIEANAVAGQTLSLWRSLTLLPADWQSVPDAVIDSETYSVTFTDPAPPSGQAFYQIRATTP